jgi:hypothetical protein
LSAVIGIAAVRGILQVGRFLAGKALQIEVETIRGAWTPGPRILQHRVFAIRCPEVVLRLRIKYALMVICYSLLEKAAVAVNTIN